MKTFRLAPVAVAAALTVGALASANAQPSQAPAPPACTPGASLQFVCGMPNPEDLVQVPRTDWIIVSSMQTAQRAGSGGLYVLDPKTRTQSKVKLTLAEPRAPFKACRGPLDPVRFSAHGLNIQPGRGGRSTLYVVGHGAREAIEVFDVATSGTKEPSMTWIGCIHAPDGAMMNSVAALSDGRVVATDFLHAPATMQDALAGRTTGAVYIWKPGGAFQKLPGTEQPGPNGIEVTPDRKHLFVAVSGTSSVLRYELANTAKGPVTTKTDFRTDNLRWGPDGKLLLAGPGTDPNCRPSTTVRCGMTSVVGALDPKTLALTEVVRTGSEPSFPGVSSALIVGQTVWLGSYNADRVASAPLRR